MSLYGRSEPSATSDIIFFPVVLYPKGCSVANLNSVGFSGENEVDLERLRTQLRKMNDAELARDIQAGEYLCPASKLSDAHGPESRKRIAPNRSAVPLTTGLGGLRLFLFF
jgi:hypothetical protein